VEVRHESNALTLPKTLSFPGASRKRLLAHYALQQVKKSKRSSFVSWSSRARVEIAGFDLFIFVNLILKAFHKRI
jgi:hypothetical protein